MIGDRELQAGLARGSRDDGRQSAARRRQPRPRGLEPGGQALPRAAAADAPRVEARSRDRAKGCAPVPAAWSAAGRDAGRTPTRERCGPRATGIACAPARCRSCSASSRCVRDLLARRGRQRPDHRRPLALGGRLRGALLGAVPALVRRPLRCRSRRGSSSSRAAACRAGTRTSRTATSSCSTCSTPAEFAARNAARQRRGEQKQHGAVRASTTRSSPARARAAGARATRRSAIRRRCSGCCGSSGWATSR